MAKIVFFGTPEYVVPIPEALKNAGHEIVAVVTQPPKPVGRKREIVPSPVAKWATSTGIKVLTSHASLLQCSEAKADIGILAAYGRIIPKVVIKLFPNGILNIHPSLLPKYRGASPVQAAIMAGEKETGVTFIKLDEEVDHGPVIAQFKEPIKKDDTTGTLRARLFQKAGHVLEEILPLYLERRILPREQEHKKATFTTLIKKSDGFVKPQDVADALGGKDSQRVERFVRAMQPWPGAWTIITKNEKKLQILKAHTEDGKLILDEVQLEGKKPVAWRQFQDGYPEAKF